jgi:AcrR family transcriptional regulator
MARPPAFDREKIIHAALSLVAERGPAGATIGAIARRLGAPTGSIYHRYPSRAVLLADLWLTTVDGFQRGLIAALRGRNVTQAGVDAALYTGHWMRAHRLEAQLLLRHRREELVGAEWPEDVRARAETVGVELQTAVREYAKRRYGRVSDANLRRVWFAVMDVPYGALKRYAHAGREVPPQIEEMIRAAATAVLSG